MVVCGARERQIWILIDFGSRVKDNRFIKKLYCNHAIGEFTTGSYKKNDMQIKLFKTTSNRGDTGWFYDTIFAVALRLRLLIVFCNTHSMIQFEKKNNKNIYMPTLDSKRNSCRAAVIAAAAFADFDAISAV